MENSAMKRTPKSIKKLESKKIRIINDGFIGVCKIEKVPLEAD